MMEQTYSRQDIKKLNKNVGEKIENRWGKKPR